MNSRFEQTPLESWDRETVAQLAANAVEQAEASAVKLIRPERAGDPQVVARFEREVRVTARLSHWNTVDVYDFGRTDDGTFFYVMEYLPGLSLEDLLRRHGPLPAERAVHLLRQA